MEHNKLLSLCSDKISKWIEYPNFWVLDAPVPSAEWLDARRFRFTGSTISGFLGHSIFESSETTAYNIINGILPEPSNRDLVEYGTATEPEARKWYEKNFSRNVQMLGFAVPRWDILVGATTDGLVIPDNVKNFTLPNDYDKIDGCIEIKCVQRIYRPIIEHRKKLQQGWKPPRYSHNHIYDSHYDQMQCTMAVLGLPWCDYILYYKNDTTQNYVERVEYNYQYWLSCHNKIKQFIARLKV